MTSEELRALRLRIDITQKEMADKLGISLPMYSLYERGKTPMSKPVAILAAKLETEHNHDVSSSQP